MQALDSARLQSTLFMSRCAYSSAQSLEASREPVSSRDANPDFLFQWHSICAVNMQRRKALIKIYSAMYTFGHGKGNSTAQLLVRLPRGPSCAKNLGALFLGFNLFYFGALSCTSSRRTVELCRRACCFRQARFRPR